MIRPGRAFGRVVLRHWNSGTLGGIWPRSRRTPEDVGLSSRSSCARIEAVDAEAIEARLVAGAVSWSAPGKSPGTRQLASRPRRE